MDASELKEILDQHQLWLAAKGGSRADLTGADLTGADLTGANLRDANLSDANLQDANLHRANLSGANLYNAYLRDANLRDANLEDVSFINANLTGANLTGANLTITFFENVLLDSTIGLPDVSWIIPGCLVRLYKFRHHFYVKKENKFVNLNFVQDSFGFIVQNNREEKTFDMLVGDKIIRGIPHWVKLSGMKQIELVSV
jgi:hypothetical protein